jgi:hypothetical protein
MSTAVSVVKSNHRPKPHPYVIGNEAIEIGVNVDLGGSIGYLRALGGDARRSRNVINSADLGREIQMSFYAPPKPYHPTTLSDCRYNGQDWPWNPIGAGNVHGDTSKILNVTKCSESSLYVQTKPLQWACSPNPVQCECTFEKTIEVLTGPIIKVTARLQNARTDQYDEGLAMNQELPAVYTNGFLYRLVTYDGSNPFKDDEPTSEFNASFDPSRPFPWIPGRLDATEHWVAFVDDRGWGLGVINPEERSYVAGFFRPEKKGWGGPHSSQTGYIAPVGLYALPRNITFEYVYYLVLGSVDHIRAVAKDVVLNKGRKELSDPLEDKFNRLGGS